VAASSMAERRVAEARADAAQQLAAADAKVQSVSGLLASARAAIGDGRG
jgi:hypothetical protein